MPARAGRHHSRGQDETMKYLCLMYADEEQVEATPAEVVAAATGGAVPRGMIGAGQPAGVPPRTMSKRASSSASARETGRKAATTRSRSSAGMRLKRKSPPLRGSPAT